MFTYTNNEEHAGEYSRGHDVQYGQKRAGHCAPDRHAHEEMTDTLLHHYGCFHDRLPYLATIFCLNDLQLGLVYGQRVGVDRRLWDKSVWQRQSKDAADKASAPQQEEIPVEASRFLEWVLAGLGRERGDIVIIVEQQHHEEPKRYSNKDPLDIQIPEVNDPVPILRWLERTNYWYTEDIGARKPAWEPVESNPEERWEGERVVGKDAADPGFPECAAAELLETVDGAEVEDCDDDGEVPACEAGGLEEVDEFFHTLD